MVFETKTWYEAEKDCVKRGAHLASIHSAKEMTFVSNTLHDQSGIHIIWIGGLRDLDKRSFKWIDGSAFNYQNWGMFSPDNVDGKEYCMKFYSDPGQHYHEKWNDLHCNYIYFIDGYVCKKDKWADEFK